MTRRDDTGGGEAAGMIVIVPFIVGFVLLVSLWGRQSEAAQHVTHAAAIGARTAALARSRDSARTDATAAIARTLAGATTACAGGPHVSVTADRWAPGGVITVEVDCTIATDDLAALNPPSRRYHSSARAVIDRYRGFQP